MTTPPNDPLNPTAGQYERESDATGTSVNVDPLSTERPAGDDPSAQGAPSDGEDRPLDGDRAADGEDRLRDGDRTADAERAEYSADQIGDDQAPVVPEDESVVYAVDPVTDPSNTPTTRTTPSAPATSEVATDEPLVPTAEGVDFKARWDVVQQGFVDDPRTAVTDADKLVGDVLDRLSKTFDEQHRTLEGQWSNGEPSTEDLRTALQRYRAFFERLLTI